MWEKIASLYFALKIVGALFGAIGGGFVGKLLTTGIKKRKIKLPVVVGCATVGGLAMWLLLSGSFGEGGSGRGFLGGGDGTPAGKTGRAVKDQFPSANEKSLPQLLKIKMLGGTRVLEQRFFVLGDGPSRNWNELVETLDAERARNNAWQEIEIVIYQNSVDRENPEVKRLEDWAKKNNLTVKLSFPPEEAP